MCGIIGIIHSSQPVAADITAGLKALEYRGYDSSGIATLHHGQMHRRRSVGKIKNLEQLLSEQPLEGKIGIGHTRWATHGSPSRDNAHPHATEHVAVVHNGIIENFLELKKSLISEGCVFTSDTDTEVVAHLLTLEMKNGATPEQAVQATLPKLKGAFALGVLFTDYPELLIAARRGSPLVIGYGETGMYLGSDALALAPFTKRVSYLLEHDWAVLSTTGAVVYDEQGKTVERAVVDSGLSGQTLSKGRHKHFMLKEIFEQPSVLGDTLNVYLDPHLGVFRLPNLDVDWGNVTQIELIACGTSYHAALTARYWLEEWGGVACRTDIASEYRYRPYTSLKNTLHIFVSQSGETADTLAAMRYVKGQGGRALAVVNVPSSSMAREADYLLPTLAGPEIGVASTKAFTTQLMVLAILAVVVGEARGSLSAGEAAHIRDLLLKIPEDLQELLALHDPIQALVPTFAESKQMLYIGRGVNYPVALEGALKIKELSYISAEGLAAGELKHGPIALVDEKMPVVVLAPRDGLLEKTASNLQEVAARQGQVILIADQETGESLSTVIAHHLVMPKTPAQVAPILYTLPLQLLAYHHAVYLGTDVDQPRNLAKSVTVE
jgi:glutamine---fructose-6-phosphate transaminase (isomerizing)